MGRPSRDEIHLFELLTLEAFQSGLSWLTILRKREGFRAAFADFDIETVAGFGERDVARLLADAGIVRHRGKIEAAIVCGIVAACAGRGLLRVRRSGVTLARCRSRPPHAPEPPRCASV